MYHNAPHDVSPAIPAKGTAVYVPTRREEVVGGETYSHCAIKAHKTVEREALRYIALRACALSLMQGLFIPLTVLMGRPKSRQLVFQSFLFE